LKIKNPNRFDFEKKKFCPIETVFTFLKLADKSKHVLFHVIFTSDLLFWRHRDRKGDSSEKICRPDRFWPAVQPVYVRSKHSQLTHSNFNFIKLLGLANRLGTIGAGTFSPFGRRNRPIFVRLGINLQF
jgi:hypothetical protein